MNKHLMFSVALTVAVAVSAVPVQAQSAYAKKSAKPSTSMALHQFSQSHRPKATSSVRSARRSDGFKVPPQMSSTEAENLRNAFDESNNANKAAQDAFAGHNYEAAEKLALRAMSIVPAFNGQRSNGAMAVLLSEIYLYQGRNREALQVLLSDQGAYLVDNYTPDLALAYYRLGDHNKALTCLSVNKEVSQYVDADHKKDLPRTGSGRGLEASILVARAYNAYKTADLERALPDFQAALKLVPGSGAVAHMIAQILERQGKYKDAVPYFEAAAQNGTGEYAKRAKASAESISYYYSPEQERCRREAERAKDKPPVPPVSATPNR